MEYKPLSGREFPRFSALKTFFRLPIAPIDADYDVALCGVPFDGGVTYRPGSRFGPSQVRDASSLGRAFHWNRGTNFVEALKVADIGDCPTVPIDLNLSYQKIEDFFSQLFSLNKRTIAIGGDHSLTLPVLRALKKKIKRPLGFVHFDAHLDTYPAAWGCEYHHGSFLRHAVDEGLIDCAHSIHIGIRGPLAGKEDLKFAQDQGLRIFSVDSVKLGLLKAVYAEISDWKEIPTYLSFDVDCFDPAFAPGTGTPVVGGLSTYEVQQILRNLHIPNLVGADIVEFCPAYDHSQITALAVVDVLFELLNIMAEK